MQCSSPRVRSWQTTLARTGSVVVTGRAEGLDQARRRARDADLCERREAERGECFAYVFGTAHTERPGETATGPAEPTRLGFCVECGKAATVRPLYGAVTGALLGVGCARCEARPECERLYLTDSTHCRLCLDPTPGHHVG